MFSYRHSWHRFALQVVSVVGLLSVLTACSSYQPDYQFFEQRTDSLAIQLPADTELADLVALAQQQHPRVLAAYAERDRARANVTVAGGLMDPELNLSQGLNDSGWRTLGVSQDIPIFQRRSMAIERASAELRASQSRLYEVKAAVAAEAMRALSEYLYVQERLLIQADSIALSEQLVAVAEQNYSTGAVPQSDFLRAQNSLDSALTEYENLKSLQRAERARLNSTLGRAANAPLPAFADLPAIHQQIGDLPESIEVLQQMDFMANPSLSAAYYQAQALHVATDIAGTAGLPRLMAGVEFMDTDMGSGTLTGMLSLSLPIWRSNYRAQQDSAQSDLSRAISLLEDLQLQLQADMSRALYQWQEAQRNISLYEDVLIPRTEQALASVLSQYRHGQASYADVTAAQQEWLSFSVSLRRALSNQLIALATIQQLSVVDPSTMLESDGYKVMVFK